MTRYRAEEDTRAFYEFGATGDVFEADFTPGEERDWLNNGLMIVPTSFRVLTDNYQGGEVGEMVELALPLEIEAALIAGGHIERVKPPTKKTKKD